jgi:flagellar hook-length control protein FliK
VQNPPFFANSPALTANETTTLQNNTNQGQNSTYFANSPALTANETTTQLSSANQPQILTLSSALNLNEKQQSPDINTLSDELDPLRKNPEEQYYSVKLSLNKSETTDDTVNKDQTGKENSEQATTATPGLQSTFSSPATAQNSGIFSTAIAAQMDIPANTSAATTPTTSTVASGSAVNDNQLIFQQINEHLQMFTKPTETQLNIKLHPAELGELKIDVTVKDGSIKAHVVAQSQQVQEIIEKNMNKLRTLLEDHGFTVDEITVANQSDSITDFNLFDEQFSKNNNSSQSDNKPASQMVDSTFQLENNLESIISTTTSVNLTI